MIKTKKSVRWSLYVNQVIAREVSTLTRYYDRVIQWLPREHDTGRVLRFLRFEQFFAGYDSAIDLDECHGVTKAAAGN